MGWRAKQPCQHVVGMAFFGDLFSLHKYLHKYAYCLSGKPGGVDNGKLYSGAF